MSRSAAPSVPKQPWVQLRSRRTLPDISPVLLLAPDAMFPAGAQRFWSSRTFVAEAQPSVPSAPKAGTASKDHPCTTKLT
jgi:hypothetical protein